MRTQRRLAPLTVTGMLVLSAGVAFAQSSPAPYTTGYRHDVGGLLTGVIRPDAGTGTANYLAVRNTYSAGLLVKVESGALSSWPGDADPTTWTNSIFTVFEIDAYTYDSMGRKVSETHSSGGAAYTLTQYSYDSMGRLECKAVRMNPAVYAQLPADACTLSTQGSDGPDRITRTLYDPRSLPLTTQRAYGTPLQQTYSSYGYSLNGKPTSVTDANGNLTQMAYDGLDRLHQITFPSKTTRGQVDTGDYEQYGYDPDDNRTSLRKRGGELINYTYDALNRLTLKQFPAGTPQDVYYGYDLRNLQLHALFGSSAGPGITHTYDGFGQLHTSTNDLNGSSWQFSYQFDPDGNRTQITHPDGAYFVYSYDGLDRLTQITENGQSALLAQVAYDTAGRRKSLTRGGGVTTSGYGYDPISRLQTLTHNLDGSATTYDVTFGFTYNAANQILTRAVSNGAYAFNSKPNVSTGYSANGLNQYTNISSTTTVSPGYDANGNLNSYANISYTYDTENRLIAASGGQTANLNYDPLGRLSETDNGTTAGTTRFLYDGDALVAEYNSSGTLLRRYVHGPGSDEPLVWYEGATVGSSNRRYYHANHQGTVIAVTNTAGATIQTDTYDAYGVTGPGNKGRFQYTGQINLPEIGLYYYKARIYNPVIGRFMQTDPVGYKDDLDLYAYVGNDPLDRTDPSGMCFEDACALEGGGALLGAVAYYGSAALVAAGLCEEACGAIHSWIGSKASAAWNHVVHNESAPSEAPKADKPSAPPGNGGTTQTPHGSPEHEATVNEEVQKMRDKGYGDIRKDQAQVDANGNKVGDNRPDVQGTNPETGQREYVEVDRNAGRSIDHYQEIMKNDPSGKCTLVPCR